MDYFQLDNIIISICFIYCVVLIVHYTVGKGIYTVKFEAKFILRTLKGVIFPLASAPHHYDSCASY